MAERPEQELLNNIIDFRKAREVNLTREYGWLSLAGLFWLKEGENPMGSAAANPIRLPERTPAHVGVFTLHGDRVTVMPAAGVSLKLRDEGVTGVSRPLHADTSGEQDFLFLDGLRMVVIERASKLAIRIWDPQSPVRRDFAGCVWYEADARFRVNAKIETYPEPRQFMIDDIVGIKRLATIHAALVFSLNGKEYRLDAERQDDNSFDIIFKDTTAGKTTYGAGRYLSTEIAKNDQLAIDFNFAYNPPCAFTEFATCPLPLSQNLLPVSIEAGEKFRMMDRA